MRRTFVIPQHLLLHPIVVARYYLSNIVARRSSSASLALAPGRPNTSSAHRRACAFWCSFWQLSAALYAAFFVGLSRLARSK
mmetsp:Transcript_3489/g.7876  ORF Transcript_3489/g.7876 Transcript_3489/m.7876 type:complete len:82 (+) Transcript_3489:74-319(+)